MLKTINNKEELIDFLIQNKTPELLTLLNCNPLYSYADAIKDAEEYMSSKYIKWIYHNMQYSALNNKSKEVLIWIVWLKKINLSDWVWTLFMFIWDWFRSQWLWYKSLQEFISLCSLAWLRKINLTVHADNTWAIHLYEKLGWTKVGTYHKQIKRSGDRYIDVLIYELFLY